MYIARSKMAAIFLQNKLTMHLNFNTLFKHTAYVKCTETLKWFPRKTFFFSFLTKISYLVIFLESYTNKVTYTMYKIFEKKLYYIFINMFSSSSKLWNIMYICKKKAGEMNGKHSVQIDLNRKLV